MEKPKITSINLTREQSKIFIDCIKDELIRIAIEERKEKENSA